MPNTQPTHVNKIHLCATFESTFWDGERSCVSSLQILWLSKVPRHQKPAGYKRKRHAHPKLQTDCEPVCLLCRGVLRCAHAPSSSRTCPPNGTALTTTTRYPTPAEMVICPAPPPRRKPSSSAHHFSPNSWTGDKPQKLHRSVLLRATGATPARPNLSAACEAPASGRHRKPYPYWASALREPTDRHTSAAPENICAK